MGAYSIAWLIIVAAAVGGAAVLYLMLRNLSKPLIRKLILVTAAVFFVVPAPVPEYPGQLAPAFVVCIFEAFFQIDGAPMVSLRILLVAMAAAAAVVAASHFLVQRLATRSTEG
jgi:hypothetical protein